ncbi:DUF4886 domain-containing protein [Clostridium swellfunianum]|uniref:DUF4886 domain-containing protein n=1 Tax=Clostridium swellfunianum TaxID=1367462 RepID=UPI00203058D1|nr:DUF4886 domain-containing protein [Clostridium swellfunianum]MCM0650010.1 DUF4886 domain-containing protein [Clostridium swellfunianum]
MKQIKILAIGNSFSEDATHYLHQISKADGIDTKVVNLYIGGCSLETHWHNAQEDLKLYLYQRDGKSTEKYVSIKDALMEDEWDFVITQQASYDSGLQETYYPYINELFKYIKEYEPKAEVLLQETWAYEIDSTHNGFGRYHYNQQEMYQKLRDAYSSTATELGVRIIPCGDIVQEIRTKEPFQYDKGGMSLCRDGFHMDYIYGRYLLAATWYEVMFGKSIMDNKYIPETVFAPNAEVDIDKLNIIKEYVHKHI